MTKTFKLNTRRYPAVPFQTRPGLMAAGQISEDGNIFLIVQIAVPIDPILKHYPKLDPSEQMMLAYSDSPVQLTATAAEFIRLAHQAEQAVTA